MQLINQIYTGANDRKSLVDLVTPDNKSFNSVVLFVHGYKGFKDWGCWNLVSDYFVTHNIGFCKLNLSHNGGTIDDSIDFPDLVAFGDNRYTYEIDDIYEGIDWLYRTLDMSGKKLFLTGHSRGGGDVILTGQDERVYGVITWASISSIANRFPVGQELQQWKEEGVRYVENNRTKQHMPHQFSFYEDWYYNQDLLDIKNASISLKKPCLHIHGTKDEAVHMKESEALTEWTSGELIGIQEADHTFGASHPWSEDNLPRWLEEVSSYTIKFIQAQH